MYNELKSFFEIISLIANTTSVFVNFKSLKIKFPIKSVKKALDESVTIEHLIEILFYRKQVMWEHPYYEDENWCINSLKDLRDKSDIEADKFLKKSINNNDSNHFFAVLLKTLGSYADECYKEIVKSHLTHKSLEEHLRKFRKQSYPIIVTFLFSLPDKSITKDNGFKKNRNRFEKFEPQNATNFTKLVN